MLRLRRRPKLGPNDCKKHRCPKNLCPCDFGPRKVINKPKHECVYRKAGTIGITTIVYECECGDSFEKDVS